MTVTSTNPPTSARAASPTPFPLSGVPGDVAEIDALCINTIRTLAMDAVQAAKSGHPGTPMSLAPVAYTLWQEFLRFDPANPLCPGRDRFVLSNGHASMLLYSLLHLSKTQALDESRKVTGQPSVPLDEIRAFRQLDSRCPGHPEYHWTAGVEATTGPLGQGLANSVGFAMAERWLAARYNRPAHELFGYRAWAICGDGCMMEGISHEAASLAGHLKLGNLCWIYDNNHITIEGRTTLAYSDDASTRFLGYGWNVLRVADANDIDQLRRAFHAATATTDRPTLIVVDSRIGWGAPTREDTSAAHGEPLGEEEIRRTKQFYRWPEDAKFLVPEGVYERFAQGVGARGAALTADWNTRFSEYSKAYPKEAAEVRQMQSRELPADWAAELPVFPADAKGMATRISNGKVINAVAKRIPWFIGGSADLAPSTKTLMTFDGAGSFEAETPSGRNLHFGIREHAMGAVCNALALSGLRPFGAGFLIFSDYMKGSIRLSAIMDLPVIYVFTHDSIGVGEDGPTHQPIEQLAALRAMPQVCIFRPCDANEVTECWRTILPMTHHPVVLALSRQDLPTLDRTKYGAASGVARGAYVLADAVGGAPELILIGTGSEVALCLAVHQTLEKEGVKVRTVSMPCCELFNRQDQAYRDSVLPPLVRARVSVEALSTLGWERYVGLDGEAIGMTTFGASAPLSALLRRFGFEPETVAARARAVLARVRAGASR
ncbi:MAG: transketolase [Phycisphaerales bacterium]|nr:transketolase [Phycisphaerales bacterium]